MGAVCPRRAVRCLPVFSEWRDRVKGFALVDDADVDGVGEDDVDVKTRS
jgi:hypothetical protein